MARVRPAVIGIDTDGWRKAPARRTASGNSRTARGLIGMLVATAVLLAGGFGVARHNTYNSDLHAAQDLATTRHYVEAIARYQTAIADWPLNASAVAGLQVATAAATAAAAPRPIIKESQQPAAKNPGSASVPAATP